MSVILQVSGQLDGWHIYTCIWTRILVQFTMYRRLRIGRDGHLDQTEAYDISQLVRVKSPDALSIIIVDILKSSF